MQNKNPPFYPWVYPKEYSIFNKSISDFLSSVQTKLLMFQQVLSLLTFSSLFFYWILDISDIEYWLFLVLIGSIKTKKPPTP